MKFLDLFWWFLDGDKSSAEIIREEKPVQRIHQIKTEEASVDVEVDDFDYQEQEEFFD